MLEPLTPARFRALAEAYGGVVARWPEADRAEAMRMAREPFAAAVLADALALDEALEAWRVPAPSHALAQRVVASGPGRMLRGAGRLRLWWSGIGLAAALAGAAAGTATVALSAPIEGAVGGGTSFGDVSGQEG